MNNQFATVFGPFHRIQNDRTQDAATIRKILTSGELWGRRPRGSDFPAVQAYAGALEAGELGVEFWAFAKPFNAYGSTVYWYLHRRPDGLVWGDDLWAKMDILVSLVRQDF